MAEALTKFDLLIGEQQKHMKKKKNVQKLAVPRVSSDPMEKKMWVLVEDKAFNEVIELLLAQGVSHDDMGDKLFVYARQAIDSMHFEAARSILQFLVSALEDKSEVPPILSLIGDLYVAENEYTNAREFYGQLPLTFENIEKTFGTFIPDKDMEGLLALRDGVLKRLTDPTDVRRLNDLVHGIFLTIAEDPVVKASATNKYSTNLHHLHKIDPAIRKKIPSWPKPYEREKIDYDVLTCVGISGRIFVRNDEVWEMVKLRPFAQRLTRKNLKQSCNIAIRCASLAHLIKFRDVLITDKPEFYKCQCYLIVNLDLLENFMMVEDLSPLVNCDFIITIIDDRELESHFRREMLIEKRLFPDFLVHFSEQDIPFAEQNLVPILNDCKQKINIEIESYEKQLAKLYPVDFPSSIIEKIKSKKLRILFQTSNYTTFLQFASRDVADGFKKLGFDVFVETEGEGKPVGIRSDICMKNLIDFRPDLIFNISHIRYEYPWIPKTLPYVTWVQDKLGPISSRQYVDKLTRNDFFFTQTFYDDLVNIGIKNILRLPVPVNPDKFNKKPKTEGWSFDITYVNHAPTKLLSSGHFLNFDNVKAKEIFLALTDQLYFEKKDVISLKDYEDSLSNVLESEYRSDEFLEKIRNTSGNYLHRTIVLDWLIESGYCPFLYGKGWSDIPKYSSIAKGEVSHSSSLENVYNETKINLHMHPYTTTHQRVFESIASGGFLLIKHIEPRKDLNPLIRYLREGEGFVFFYNRSDLLEKIQFYLANDDKRVEIINSGREKVLHSFTYQRAVQFILETILKRYAKI